MRPSVENDLGSLAEWNDLSSIKKGLCEMKRFASMFKWFDIVFVKWLWKGIYCEMFS